jgi:hypothetical protein
VSVHPLVEAAPFAAHLGHIGSVSRLPWQVLALAANVPLAWGDALINGVSGRPLKLVPAEIARRVLSLDEDIRARLAKQRVPADETAARLLYLLRSGWHPPALARRVGLSLLELSATLRGAPQVARLTELTVAALESSHRARAARAAA